MNGVEDKVSNYLPPLDDNTCFYHCGGFTMFEFIIIMSLWIFMVLLLAWLKYYIEN